MATPLVSIVVPTYNAARWLDGFLDDMRAQTLDDFELIFVDDASTDDTPRILQALSGSPRTRVITHERNWHAGVSRNDGMAAARGTYLLFLDADDRFNARLVERATARADETGAEVVLFNADDFTQDPGQTSPNPLFQVSELIPAVQPFDWESAAEHLFQICTPEPWNKLFLRSFVQGLGLQFQDTQNTNDLYFTLSALSSASRIATCPDVLVHHRVGAVGGVQTNRSRQPLAFIEALGALLERLRATGSYAALEKSFVNLALFHCDYNSDAPADWPSVFERFGITSHAGADFFSQGGFDRCVEMLMGSLSEDGRAQLPKASAEFWRDAALTCMRWAKQARQDASDAQREVDLIMSSVSFRLGHALTAPARALRSKSQGS